MCDIVIVVVTLQGETPFLVGIDVVKDFLVAQELKEKYESQYEYNRVYIYDVPVH